MTSKKKVPIKISMPSKEIIGEANTIRTTENVRNQENLNISKISIFKHTTNIY